MDNYDTERFIEEIENRPALCDSTLEEYCNREVKKQCWNDIVDIFGGKGLTATERRYIEITLQKKWKGIRGCFTRELKRQEKLRGGDSPGPRNLNTPTSNNFSSYVISSPLEIQTMNRTIYIMKLQI